MRKNAYKKYLFALAILFGVMSISPLFIEKMRTGLVRKLSPLLSTSLHVKKKYAKEPAKGSCLIAEKQKLDGENHLLRLEVKRLSALLDKPAAIKVPSESVAADVIYRDPLSWGSALWVGVGEETNRHLGKKIIEKNSPVLVGKAVVGSVDFVGEKQSRVRLLTDSKLRLSVRAARGAPQNALLLERIDHLLATLRLRKDLLSSEESVKLTQTLQQMREKLSNSLEGWLLAKGVLEGSGSPLWRSRSQSLHGSGFNYDFADDEGPARELVASAGSKAMALLQVGDVLITTGMDGVFPKGLRVAEVTKVHPLREGAYTYEIEARSVLGNLDELETVFIIPALGFEVKP